MSLSRIDLNLLVVLDTVLSERSVVRAAQRLHLTPSAISNSLARLREIFGDPLVVRNGRGVVPTSRAEALAPALKLALNQMERVIQADAFDPATTTREFTLAVADAGQLSRLPKLVKLLSNQMPRARLRVVGIDTYVSSGGVGKGEIDVALIAADEEGPGIHATPLYRETSVLVSRHGHACARKRISKAQLGELLHVEVQVAPGRGYRELARQYAELDIKREIAVIVPSFMAAAAVVADTDFVATLPESLVKALGPRLGVELMLAPAPKVSLDLKLIWHDRTDGDPAMRAFRSLVSQAMTQPKGRQQDAAGK
jgi:DNA-binding transcriptional LysR family regulator